MSVAPRPNELRAIGQSRCSGDVLLHGKRPTDYRSSCRWRRRSRLTSPTRRALPPRPEGDRASGQYTEGLVRRIRSGGKAMVMPSTYTSTSVPASLPQSTFKPGRKHASAAVDDVFGLEGVVVGGGDLPSYDHDLLGVDSAILGESCRCAVAEVKRKSPVCGVAAAEVGDVPAEGFRDDGGHSGLAWSHCRASRRRRGSGRRSGGNQAFRMIC